MLVRSSVVRVQFTSVSLFLNSNTPRRCYSEIPRLKEETEYSNLTDHIREKLSRKLLHQPHHPLRIIKEKIFHFFNTKYQSKIPGPAFHCFDDLPQLVTVADNFDKLLTPPDHVTRKKDESYYVNENQLLRCHMTAHQTQLLAKPELHSFLYAGDVYRRDAIDSTHYPIFHQLDGVRVFKEADLLPIAKETGKTPEELVVEDMKTALEQMTRYLFEPTTQIKWVDAYFPFTDPSFEMEILFDQKSSTTNQQNEWLEVLGCGLTQTNIIKPIRSDSIAWAFGLGLERLAMILFSIPDIRLFWSNDPRFTSQFNADSISKFKSYSKYPPCFKDITFWLPENFTDNNFFEIARGHCGDLIESIELLDHFTHPKTQRQSKCFRLNYRSMERSLTNEEINELQDSFRALVVSKLGVEIR